MTGNAYLARAGVEAVYGRSWRIEARRERRGISWRVFGLGVALLLLALAGGFVYIREITSTAASGYDVSFLERRAEELRSAEQRLLLERAELESLRRIEEHAKTLNLVPVVNTAYTSPLVGETRTGQIPVGTATR